MKICRAPNCDNPAILHRTICTKHKHRLRKNGTFEVPERIKKVELLTNGIVKICKVHGELKYNQVTVQYSKYKDKKYKYYQCKECRSIKMRRLYWKNPEKYRKYALSQRKKHYEKCLERDRKYKIKLLSESEFNKLSEKQNSVCAICKNPEKAKVQKSRTLKMKREIELKRLSIDHCHTTGKIRGLLCQSCNTSLGGFKDSIEILQSAIEYLKSNQ